MASCFICFSNTRKEKVAMFRVPANQRMREMWNSSCQVEFQPSSRVCQYHFVRSDFINPPGSKLVRLMPNAVPSVFDQMRPRLIKKTKLDVANAEENTAELSTQTEYENQTFKKTNETFYKSDILHKGYDHDNSSINHDSLLSNLQESTVENSPRDTADGIAESTHTWEESTLEEKQKLKFDDELEISVEEFSKNLLEFHGRHTVKCGEIIFDSEHETFILNCFLCAAICADLLIFSEHVKRQHSGLLKENVINPLDDYKINPEYFKSSTYLNSEVSSSELKFSNVESSIDIDNNNVVNNALRKSYNNKKESTNFEIDNFGVVSQFINLLKHKPTIWRKSINTLSNYKRPRNAITSIADSLSKLFPDLIFTFQNVANLLDTLRTAYFTEVNQSKNAKFRNLKYIPRLWCFDQLKFLGEKCISDSEDINNLEQLVSQFPLDILHQVGTSDDEIITLEIINCYEKYPQLWNINHPDYHGKLSNEESFKEFYESLNKKYSHKTNITKGALKSSIKRLHQWYIAEKAIRRNMRKICKPYKSCYPEIYKALEFLKGNLPPFYCGTCAKIFRSDENYVKHKGNCKSVVHQCEHCQKRFPALKFLKQHLFKHSTERPVICAICGKSYKNKIYLGVHVRAHVRAHAEKLFKCNECNRSYRTLRLLHVHQKSHLGIRDKICDICGKTFTTAKYLYQHRISHFEERKPTCQNCGKKLAIASMKAHRKKCFARLLQQAKKQSGRRKRAKDSDSFFTTNQVKTIFRTDNKTENTNEVIAPFSIDPDNAGIQNQNFINNTCKGID